MLLAIWFFKDFQGAEFPYSRRGLVKKVRFFQHVHLGGEIFPSLTKSRACFEIPNI